MSEDKWHRRFLEMACLIASWSKDPRKQVGCVLVDEYNRIVATGYNGPPRGIDVTEEERLEVTIHAEVNAILTKQRDFVTAYVWPCLPCSRCAAILVQAGCQRIVSKRPPSEKWRWDLGQKLCEQKEVEVILC